MSKQADYPLKSSPVAADLVNIVDSEDDSQSSAGSTKRASLGTLPFLQPANDLSELVSTSAARTNLGLGSAAVQNTNAFDAAGAAAAATAYYLRVFAV